MFSNTKHTPGGGSMRVCFSRSTRVLALVVGASVCAALIVNVDLLSPQPSRTVRLPKAETHQNASVREPTRKVIIVAYKRGGSSFVGSLFDQNEDCWYLFEPLAFFMSGVIDVSFPKKAGQLGPRLSPKWDELRAPYANLTHLYSTWTSYLDNLLRCDFSTPRLKDYYNSGVSRRGLDWRESGLYFNPALFVQKSPGLRYSLLRSRSLEKSCRAKSVVAMKLIRLQHLEALEGIMNSSGVRVLHLVRDPRAVMVSRRQTDGDAGAKLLCERMAANLRLSQSPAGSGILTLRYEDIAVSPVALAHAIYEQLGLEMPQSVVRWIRANTQVDGDDLYREAIGLGLTRNSTRAAEHWITDIEPAFARSMDSNTNCQYVYKHMNYSYYDDLTPNP